MNLILPSFFFLLFYVVMPVFICLFKGGGWSRLYALASSSLAAYWAYMLPAQFIKAFLPEAPSEIEMWLETLFTISTSYGRLMFAALTFALLYIFQFRIITKLVETIIGLTAE